MMFAVIAALSVLWVEGQQQVPSGEKPVKPYEITNENAGAKPYPTGRYFKAFQGMEGVKRIADGLVVRLTEDKRVEGIFRASDLVRLRRTLAEQFCYLLGGPCDYTGRTMRSSHKTHGITQREFYILVELLQQAMTEEEVSFSAQNKLLAKLAPLYREVVTR